MRATAVISVAAPRRLDNSVKGIQGNFAEKNDDAFILGQLLTGPHEGTYAFDRQRLRLRQPCAPMDTEGVELLSCTAG